MTSSSSPCAQPPVGRVPLALCYTSASTLLRCGFQYCLWNWLRVVVGGWATVLGSVVQGRVLGIACKRARMIRTDGCFHGSAGPVHPLGRRCASTRLTVSLRVAQVWPAYPRQRNRPARPHMLTTRSLTRMDARKHAQSRSQTCKRTISP